MNALENLDLRFEASLDDRKLSLIEDMFISPADADYVSARWSYANGMFHNFYWNSSQAIEKYCKAVMLMNGHSVQKPTHDVKDLYTAALKIDSEGILPRSIDTQNISGIGKDWWHGKDINVFIEHISIYGSPDNRYGHAGTHITSALIIVLDKICSKLRELIRFKNIFSKDLFAHHQKKAFPHERNDNPLPWMLNHDLMLEKLHRRIVEVGQKRSLRGVFLKSNRSFLPGNRIRSDLFTGLHSTFFPLVNQIVRLKHIDKSQENARIVNSLERWVTENIYISKQMKKDIDEYRKIVAGRNGKDV